VSQAHAGQYRIGRLAVESCHVVSPTYAAPPSLPEHDDRIVGAVKAVDGEPDGFRRRKVKIVTRSLFLRRRSDKTIHPGGETGNSHRRTRKYNPHLASALCQRDFSVGELLFKSEMSASFRSRFPFGIAPKITATGNS
jgi:hypothetical protein